MKIQTKISENIIITHIRVDYAMKTIKKPTPFFAYFFCNPAAQKKTNKQTNKHFFYLSFFFADIISSSSSSFDMENERTKIVSTYEHFNDRKVKEYDDDANDLEKGDWAENPFKEDTLPLLKKVETTRTPISEMQTSDKTSDLQDIGDSPEDEFERTTIGEVLKENTTRKMPVVKKTIVRDEDLTFEDGIFDSKNTISGRPTFEERPAYYYTDDYAMNWHIWLTVWVMLYLVGFILFLLFVTFKIPWSYGYYGAGYPYETAWLNDKYTFVWGIMLLTLTHIAVPASILYISLNLKDPFHSDVSFTVCLFGLLSSVFVGVSLLGLLIFACNNGVFRNVACDDANRTRYCLRWGNSSTINGCPADLEPFYDDTLTLSVNETYYYWIYYVIWCAVYSVMSLIIGGSVEKYRFMGAFNDYDRTYVIHNNRYAL